MSICCICSFGLFFQLTYEKLLQSTGTTIYSMLTQGLGAITNIILDPILIFGWFGLPKMGVAGAAIATVIGQIFGAALGIYLNKTKNHEISFHMRNFRPNGAIIKRIYSVGIPSIIMQSISSVLTFGMNKILISFTSTATAVFGVYFKLQSFVFMPVFGLNNGMVPIVSYNYGARKPQRIKKTMKLSIIYAVSIMLLGIAAFMLIPAQLLGFFNASENMVAIGVPALRIISLSFLFAGFNIITSSICQALGKGMLSLWVSVVRQLVVLLPAAYFLSFAGLDAVWWAFPIAEIASLMMCILFQRKIDTQIIRPLSNAER